MNNVQALEAEEPVDFGNYNAIVIADGAVIYAQPQYNSQELTTVSQYTLLKVCWQEPEYVAVSPTESCNFILGYIPMDCVEIVDVATTAQTYCTYKVLEKAKSYLGTPYLWGGTTPQGFDCSGYVQYVYTALGYDISRTTYTQIHDGIWVDKNDIQQGDLIFFGAASSPHHVGIYIGNNEYIHAPHTGDVVKISSLSSRSDFSTARRIIY